MTNINTKVGFKGHLTLRKNGEIVADQDNLITNEGFRFIAERLYDISAITTPFNPANYIEFGTDTTDLDATATALASPVTTAGLSRAQAGTRMFNTSNVVTIENEFNVTGTINGISTVALFNASTGGTLVHVINLANNVNLVDGDTLTATWTITLSNP